MVDARRCRFHRCSQLRRNRKNSEDGVAPSLQGALFVTCTVGGRRRSAGRDFVRGGRGRQRRFVIWRCNKAPFTERQPNATSEAVRPLAWIALLSPALRSAVLAKLGA